MALDAPEAAPGTRPLRAAVADETLLDALAALTPEERLRWNDRMATTVLELRNGFAAAEPDHAARPAGGKRD
jgi:hypothetical protein